MIRNSHTYSFSMVSYTYKMKKFAHNYVSVSKCTKIFPTSRSPLQPLITLLPLILHPQASWLFHPTDLPCVIPLNQVPPATLTHSSRVFYGIHNNLQLYIQMCGYLMLDPSSHHSVLNSVRAVTFFFFLQSTHILIHMYIQSTWYKINIKD